MKSGWTLLYSIVYTPAACIGPFYSLESKKFILTPKSSPPADWSKLTSGFLEVKMTTKSQLNMTRALQLIVAAGLYGLTD